MLMRRQAMRAIIIGFCAAGLLSFAATGAATAEALAAPVVINHNCTDLDAIPPDAIATAQNVCKWHYARLSHGRQLMVGFTLIEAADPFYAVIWPKAGGSLPVAPGELCIYTDPVDAESYWVGAGLDNTRAILTATPELNISAMSWCTELNTASESYVQDYLAAMQTLESEFPTVTFVYFTGTAEYDGAYGYNRSLRNEQIRNFCVANDKVLYDFEDLDSWWFNPDTQEWEQATYLYNGRVVPVEHPMLAGDDAEHTSYESCEQKGRRRLVDDGRALGLVDRDRRGRRDRRTASGPARVRRLRSLLLSESLQSLGHDQVLPPRGRRREARAVRRAGQARANARRRHARGGTALGRLERHRRIGRQSRLGGLFLPDHRGQAIRGEEGSSPPVAVRRPLPHIGGGAVRRFPFVFDFPAGALLYWPPISAFL
jgi:hypothetical protein